LPRTRRGRGDSRFA
jgi:hypothetical protein